MALALSVAPAVGGDPWVFVSSLCDPGCAPLPNLNAVPEAELYAVILGGPAPTDWQVSTLAKGGPSVGAGPLDVNDALTQTLSGNFRDFHLSSVVAQFVSKPGGRVHLISGAFPARRSFTWLGCSREQQVGDSSPPGPSAGPPVVLPEAPRTWEATLEGGVSRFPSDVDGWALLAFAPLIEVGTLPGGAPWPNEGCAAGGHDPDPLGDGRILTGYNVYRLVVPGGPPAPSEVAQVENWVDFIPVPPTPDSQAWLSDPDGRPDSGDDVIVWTDSPFAQDGGPRLHGSAGVLAEGETAWYAVQPVIRGLLSAFPGSRWSIELGGDLLDDLDGDGVFESVDFNGPGSADGPEFISPQAQDGVTGLGLTVRGAPLVSKLMAANACLTAHALVDLEVNGNELLWNAIPAVSEWTVLRSDDPGDFMNAAAWTVAGTGFVDPDPPPPSGLWFYRVEPDCAGNSD